jgi:predicted transcriptional regulator
MTNKKEHAPYRSKEDINSEILKIVRDGDQTSGRGIYKTKLLYNTRLNEPQIRPYLQTLLDNGLMLRDSSKSKLTAGSTYSRQHSRGDRFHITRKGLEYLRVVEEIHRALPTAGIHI